MTIILLIENDEGDVFLFRRALSRVNYGGSLRVVGSVSEARAYLEGTGPFIDREYYPVPDLIVSDMNLPGPTGNDFLEWLREDERFTAIPLVFLSGSFQPSDRVRSTELGADSFFTKSGDIEKMVERVRNMLKFLPPENE
jgi:DNA-binding response OmpR family regulator